MYFSLWASFLLQNLACYQGRCNLATWSVIKNRRNRILDVHFVHQAWGNSVYSVFSKFIKFPLCVRDLLDLIQNIKIHEVFQMIIFDTSRDFKPSNRLSQTLHYLYRAKLECLDLVQGKNVAHKKRPSVCLGYIIHTLLPAEQFPFFFFSLSQGSSDRKNVPVMTKIIYFILGQHSAHLEDEQTEWVPVCGHWGRAYACCGYCGMVQVKISQ